MTYNRSHVRIPESIVVNLKNCSYRISASVTIDSIDDEGVICCQGGNLAGWSLYLQAGRPHFVYNLFGQQITVIRGDRLTVGSHDVVVEFDYDGGGLGKGGDVRLYVDGDQVGTGRVEATVPNVYSADETTDLGEDTGTAVSDDYAPGDSSFNGIVRWVQIDLGDDADDADHLITPEERLKIAMARQ